MKKIEAFKNGQKMGDSCHTTDIKLDFSLKIKENKKVKYLNFCAKNL